MNTYTRDRIHLIAGVRPNISKKKHIGVSFHSKLGRNLSKGRGRKGSQLDPSRPRSKKQKKKSQFSERVIANLYQIKTI